MTALRETLEETGILLVEQPTTNATNATNATAEQLAAARLAIHSRTDPLTFPDFLARYHLQPPVDKLVPFSQWITPEDVPVRFHARFYVLFTEELDLQGAVVEQVQPPTSEDGGGVRVQNPTADGGVEIISASWIHPRDLFAAFRKGELSLFPPQYYLLTTLGNLLDSMPQGSNRTEALRRYVDGFGSRLFNPRPTGFTEEGGKGQRAILTYEGDELRGGNVGDRHRSLVLYQGRVSGETPICCCCCWLLTFPKRIADIELQRNIDVLTPLDRSESKARL